jgi:hypothetical protein
LHVVVGGVLVPASAVLVGGAVVFPHASAAAQVDAPFTHVRCVAVHCAQADEQPGAAAPQTDST